MQIYKSCMLIFWDIFQEIRAQLLAAKHKTVVRKCVSNYSYLRLALVTLAFSEFMERAFHCAVLAISSDMFTIEGSTLKNKHTFWLVFNTLQQHYTYRHSSITSVVPSFNIYAATSWIHHLERYLNKNFEKFNSLLQP